MFSYPTFADEYAYALRFNPNEPEYLIQFDTTKNEIARKIELPHHNAFNDMVVDENGGCFITDYYYISDYGRKIYYYDPKKNKISGYKDLGSAFGPHYISLTKDYLIVQVESFDETRGFGGVVIIGRKNKKIVKKIYFRKDDPLYRSVEVLTMTFDGDKYAYFVTCDFINSNTPHTSLDDLTDFGGIIVVDVTTQKVVKIIEVPKDYTNLFGVCSVGNKIYIAAATNKFPEYNNGRHKSNREILVFSLKNGQLIKKIPISPHPFWVTYDKSVNKIYVLHRRDDFEEQNNVEVISTLTDKVIGSFEVKSQLMFSVVAPGKLYMTKGPSFMHETTSSAPELLVLDTKTDKIIKRFYGNYQGISVNPKY